MFYIKLFTLKLKFKKLNTKPLNLAILFIKVIRVIMYISITAFIGMLIYSLIDSESFSNLVVQNAFRARFTIGDFRFCSNCTDPNLLTLPQIATSMKLWLLLRGSVLMTLMVMSLQVLLRILRSIQQHATFYDQNIKGFLMLFRLGMVMAIISSFNFFIQGTSNDIEFSIPFGVLGYSLGCRLLAEIFKEGKMLAEDSHSII